MGRFVTRRNVLLLSLMLALITSSLVYKFLRNQSRNRTVMTMPVIVTDCVIPARKVIEPQQLRVRYMPSSSIRGDVCSSMDEVAGKATLAKLDKGAVVSPTDVGEPTIKLGLAYGIPPYMRAITVGIDDVSGVAGFLKPGDHVDVVGAFESNSKATAKTVLQDVELLALGGEVEQEKVTKNTGKARSDRKSTATLVVTPEDAEKLVLADSQGKLRLVLRAPGDVVRVNTSGVNSPKVTGIPDERPQTSTAGAAAEPMQTPVQVKPAGQMRAPVRPLVPSVWPRSAAKPQKSWGSGPLSPLSISPIKTQHVREIQVIRGNKIESVEVEDTDKSNRTPTTQKEVSGAAPAGK